MSTALSLLHPSPAQKDPKYITYDSKKLLNGRFQTLPTATPAVSLLTKHKPGTRVRKRMDLNSSR